MPGSIRSQLAETAAYLKEAGQHERALSVESVLAPGGWKQLRDSEARLPKTLNVYMSPDLKAALVAASQEFGWPLDALAEEAYRKVRDGEWLPPKTGRGEGGARAVLPVQVDREVHDQVHGMLPELTSKAGYRVSHAGIVVSYMCEELGIERPNTAKAESLEMRFPKALVAHWKRQAAAEGVELEQVVADGIHRLLDGEWTPQRHPYFADRASVAGSSRAGGWSESERQRFWLPVDRELLADLRAKTEELSGQLGYLVYPGAVVRAILTDRLGEPAE
ncbi:hypothetical protein [Streptomyces griseosporeus]|uniref:hypothetical protein n=1 Tax=Streptomyces griseosporeus TaxID=1910 RepID=UPI003702C9AD